MLSSGMADSTLQTSGRENVLPIPTRFVWPHGGRRVYLTGSFTGWSEHIVMLPTEGCPTVFQAVCSVMPGFHQYKFCVDGEWRHDEHQPCASGNFGIVNTIMISREPNIDRQEATVYGMHMDVDNDVFDRVVTLPRGALQGSVARIPDTDMETSRHRISAFLSNHTAYELMPESGKGIPVAPLWDSYKGQFVGVLSALDFILILRKLGNHGSSLNEEELETHSISAWKEEKLLLDRKTARRLLVKIHWRLGEYRSHPILLTHSLKRMN